MNPFRSRKKSFTEGDSRRPSVEDAPPVPTTGFRGRTFRRKKNQPEPKPEVDIATVLPSQDEFRTSLLMPNLSARFSMLREQDDPNTKIGKANDDSVLFPKRASRMNLFGDNNLNDIAEVSSLTGSIKRPWMNERNGSYSSADAYSYTTDDEGKSIMDRSRQVKGNKFFANRQKVYMIPAQGSVSMKDLHTPAETTEKVARPMGKLRYNDDVNMAKFDFGSESNLSLSEDKQHGRRSSDDRERRGSLQHSDHNSKRETSSSTNSGPADSRASTAATSVASQSASPMNGPGTNGNSFPFNKNAFNGAGNERSGKSKRLYGQGLDQQIHEQQSSALQRLNSLQRPYALPQSRSATNLHDRPQKPGPLYSSNNFRAMSPIPGSSNNLSGFDFGMDEGRSRSNSRETNYQGNVSPTMSPPMSPTDPTLAAALEPNDLGKATATGAFNKPKTPYSDEQFAKRQMQLQESRAETPPLTSFSRPGAYGAVGNRDRKESSASQISGHSVYSQNKSQAPMLTSPHPLNIRKPEPPLVGNQPINGAYLVSPGASEFDSEPTSPIDPAISRTATHTTLASVIDPISRHRKYEHDDRHPAFSSHLNAVDKDHGISSSQHMPAPYTDLKSTEDAAPSSILDSPTLPTADEAMGSSGGLNDLIRGHLRNFSNASSVYPSSPPRRSEEFFLDRADAASIDHAAKVANEMADMQFAQNDQPPIDSLSANARRILEQANQLKNAPTKPYEVLGGVGGNKVQQVLGGEAPCRSNEMSRGTPNGHTRGASTETQKEREEFANELADRRKQVQDNLKSFVEDNRSTSAAGRRNFEDSPARNGPLGLLKKASRNSIVGRSENPSKPVKMLGTATISSQAPPGQLNGQPNMISPEAYAGSRPVLNGDIRHRVPRQLDQPYKVASGQGPSFRDRSIGAERRAPGFQRRGPSPSPHRGSEWPGPENMGPARAASAAAAKQPSPKPNGYGFVRSQTDNFNNVHNQAMPPMPRPPRKYSPPGTSSRPNDQLTVDAPTMRSISAQGHYPRGPHSPYSPGHSYFPAQPRSPNPQGDHFPPTFNDSPRPSPVTAAFQARNTPPMEYPPSMPRNGPLPMNGQRQPPQHRKRSINKEEISTPTFMSSTSTVITVDLPNGASLANGMNEVGANAPPVPPLNPRRRKAAPTQNLFTGFVNKSSNNLSAMSTPSSVATSPHSGTPFLQEPPYEEKSYFQSEEGESKQRPRTRLRKVSSDGGNMAARARHQALKEMDHMQMPMTPMHASGDGHAQPMF